tara:strand:+ start:772 stop:954 length:183 start_codon:yes stop_codon:yes gene_type:complete
MKTILLCVSITCPICGDFDSGANRRGFSRFMRKHVASCGADGFTISEGVSLDLEWPHGGV